MAYWRIAGCSVQLLLVRKKAFNQRDVDEGVSESIGSIAGGSSARCRSGKVRTGNAAAIVAPLTDADDISPAGLSELSVQHLLKRPSQKQSLIAQHLVV